MPFTFYNPPSLTPEQMSPLNAAFSQYLNRKKQLTDLQYQPMQHQADVLSKAAYAAYTPYSYLAKGLQPEIFGFMTDEQQKQLLQKLASMPTNPMESLSAVNAHQGGNQGWLEGLRNFIGGNNAPGQQQMPQQGMQPSNQQMNIPQQPQEFGAQNQATPAQVADIAQNGNDKYQPSNQPIAIPEKPSQEDQRKLNYIRMFPNSPQAKRYLQEFELEKLKKETEIRGQERTSEKRLERQEKALEKYEDEAEKFVTQADDYGKALDNFHSEYQQSTLVGRGVGKLASFGTNSAQAKHFASILQAGQAAKAFGNRITNAKLELAKTMKLHEELPRKAEEELYNKFKLANDRDKELGNFIRYAVDNGITDKNKITNLYNNYNTQYPIYTSQVKDKKSVVTMHPENINKYENFINDQINKRKPRYVSEDTENKSIYARNPQEMHNSGKQAAQTKMVNGKRYGKFGNEWHFID